MIFDAFQWFSLIFHEFQWFSMIFNDFYAFLILFHWFEDFWIHFQPDHHKPKSQVSRAGFLGRGRSLQKSRKTVLCPSGSGGTFGSTARPRTAQCPAQTNQNKGNGSNRNQSSGLISLPELYHRHTHWQEHNSADWLSLADLMQNTLVSIFILNLLLFSWYQVPNSQNFDTYELQTRSWFDVWKNHATYINGPGHMSLADPIFFSLQNRDPDRTNFEFWKNDARYINGPCNMSLTKANISKIKPLPGPTGTNFEKHKRNCIATLFGLVFSFEFVWELCNQLVWSPMTRIIQLGGFA